MASENIGQILIDNECVADMGELRALMASGQVKQGERVLTNKNERVDTKDGPVTVGAGTTIHDWLDHSLN